MKGYGQPLVTLVKRYRSSASQEVEREYLTIASGRLDVEEIIGTQARIVLGARRPVTDSTGAGDGMAAALHFRSAPGGVAPRMRRPFLAPGHHLAEGSYHGATRAAFRAPGVPGLDVFGNGRGCNELTGTFTVLEASYGPSNYLERFGATFEQRCEGALPALRGEVWVVNPPAPTPLELGVVASLAGTVDRLSGTTVVSGSVTCSVPTTLWMQGTLVQRASRTTVSQGTFFLDVACSGTTPWEASVMSHNGVPFNPGKAALEVDAASYDTGYGRYVNVTTAATIRLTGGPTR